jgi:hypothetical protein
VSQKTVLLLVWIIALLAPVRAVACANHIYFDPDQFGFFGGAVVRMAGLAPPKPVFELEHPLMIKAVIGDESEVTINYSKPFFSKNVSLVLQGTSNVRLLKDVILLEDRSGSISIPYQLGGSGYDSITLTISGEYKGEMVRQRGQIYIRAKPERSSKNIQVSER